VALLRHKSPVVRADAATHIIHAYPRLIGELYGLTHDEAPVTLFMGGCTSGTAALSWHLVDLLCRPTVGDVSSDELLASAAYDDDVAPLTRLHALKCIQRIDPPRARCVALSVLGAKDVELRIAALRALREVGLVGDLAGVDRLTRSGDETLRAEARVTAHGLRSEPTPEQYFRLFSHPDSLARRAAAHEYAADPNANIDVLRRILDDNDMEVVSAASDALAALGTPAALAALRSVMMSYRPPMATLSLLTREVRQDRVAWIRSMLAASDSRVRTVAIEYLSRARDRESSATIRRFLSGSSAPERLAACRALARLDDRAAATALESALTDMEPAVVTAAGRALAQLHARQSLPALERAAARERSETRNELLRAIEALRDGTPVDED
jgi:HEAT repeat protein